MQYNRIELIALEERHFVGVPVTNAFQKINSASLKAANGYFLERKHEIQGIINPHEYVCPHFANDILFTYIFCMEVAAIEDVPDGMIGFSVPGQHYAKVRSKEQDPYALIKSFLKERGMENNPSSLALEVFRFGEKQSIHHADIYVPVLASST